MKRKGTSPVIGEFMLIVAVILVAAPTIGFTFGTLGNFTHPAEVTVSSSSCGAADNSTTECNFVLSNLGAGSTQTVPTAIFFTHQGNSTQTTVFHSCLANDGYVVNGGASLALSCHFDLAPGASENGYSGSIVLENGASVPFVGMFE